MNSQQGIDFDKRQAKEKITHAPNKLDVPIFGSLCNDLSPHVRKAANGPELRSRIICRSYSPFFYR